MSDERSSPHGVNAKQDDLQRDTVDYGEQMTTNQGLPVGEDQHSLKAGLRGPTLLEDFHFREKMTHFDHERIPERVVHARGTAAHGFFEAYEDLGDLTRASLFSKKGKKTPVFVRFSTVAGSRGSVDTPRDVRGFAIKFYTDEGVWDLVGNNIPVFFIRDAIKFPDLIHSVKPEPHNEVPQAQSAHDTFWDFAGLMPELTHMLMWVMSDRALPRSLAMMQGFGIHTFRMINAEGKSHFVKFHFKPKKGVHSLVWDEAQKVAGKDPDFNRRDLFESIEAGDYPEWEMGVQVVPEEDEMKFDFDILDATKIIPEEEVPVRPIGRLVLDRNPDNYFAETEQVAFHPGHIVPGLDFSNDPLLQGRLFSYIDTQIKRVGPNFAQIPINRSLCPVHNNQRDAESQQTIHKGRVAYFPNSLAGNCPAHSPEGMQAFQSYAEKMDGQKVRARSDSFEENFAQATLFWNSMAEWEKSHIAEAFSFELNMCDVDEVRSRVVNELLVNVHPDLAGRVSEQTGVKITKKGCLGLDRNGDKTSPALSMDKQPGSVKGRKVAILAGEGVDGDELKAVKSAIEGEGGNVEVIAKRAGSIKSADGKEIKVDRAAPNAPPFIYDGVYVPSGGHVDDLKKFGLARQFVNEMFAHYKTIAASGNAVEFLAKAQLNVVPGESGLSDKQGVITAGEGNKDIAKAFVDAVSLHRHFDRDVEDVAA